MRRSQWLLIGGGTALFVGGLVVGRNLPTEDSRKASSMSAAAKSETSHSRAASLGVEQESDGGQSKGASGRVFQELFFEGDVGSRYEQLLIQLDRTDSEDFAAMLEEVEARGFNRVMGTERVMIISAWAKRDPVAAAQYLKDNGEDGRLRFAAMSTWAANDPDAALDWARNAHEGEGANRWLVGVIRGIAGSDANRAAELMSELPQSREQRWAMESAMPFVMDQGAEFSRSWIESLDGEGLQSRGAEWMARRMAGENPEDAARWVAGLATKDARREASEQVALRYAREDLSAAQSWVSSLPEDTRTEAAEGVVSVMAEDDPRAAIAWLEKLGDDPDYDGAWVDVLEKGFEAEPGVALVSALRLSDEGWREKYTNNYLSKWMKKDKEAATRWVQDYTEYLPPRAARRFVPKPPKNPKTKAKNAGSFLEVQTNWQVLSTR